MKLLGREYTRREILRYAGNPSQAASAKRMAYADGPGRGDEAIFINDGAGLEYELQAGRGLDIYSLSYRGVNCAFKSKAGPSSGRGGFVKYSNCGMLFTCGLRNIGPGCEFEGETFPLHGDYNVTPASGVYARETWEGDEYILTAGGKVKEAALFAHNLELSREITTPAGSGLIEISDTLSNNGDETADCLILYHVNFGFPFLDAETAVTWPECEVIPRTDEARAGLDKCGEITPPIDGFFEHVFLREPEARDGSVNVTLENKRLGIGAELSYENEYLPYLAQWKSMKSGDYALGIEPASSLLFGRAEEVPNGRALKIAPFGSVNIKLRLRFFDV